MRDVLSNPERGGIQSLHSYSHPLALAISMTSAHVLPQAINYLLFVIGIRHTYCKHQASLRMWRFVRTFAFPR